MADTKISSLPTVSSPQLSDYLVGDFSNSSYTGKVLISNLVALLAASVSPAFADLSYTGLLTGGSNISYSDTGIIATFAKSTAGYNQIILQNINNSSNASTNFNVSNDQGTATSNYGEFGINSSTFAGSGAFNKAGAVYLAAATGDLAIGTYGSGTIHFVVNSGATDAMTISSAGTVNIPGTFSAGSFSATSINSTPIGNTTPSTGAFTTLSAGSGLNGTAVGNTTPSTGAFITLSATGQITSTLASGTAPFVVGSTTQVANLNSSYLGGATFASPGPIGGTVPSSGSFTSLTLSSALSITQGGTGAVSAAAALIALGERTGATGSLVLPNGTTAQRDAVPSAGWLRWNSTLSQAEVWNGTAWTGVGGGVNQLIQAGGVNVLAGTGQVLVGPITVPSGQQIVVASGARLVIL